MVDLRATLIYKFAQNTFEMLRVLFIFVWMADYVQTTV
jgi:hypothetical protein